MPTSNPHMSETSPHQALPEGATPPSLHLSTALVPVPVSSSLNPLSPIQATQAPDWNLLFDRISDRLEERMMTRFESLAQSLHREVRDHIESRMTPAPLSVTPNPLPALPPHPTPAALLALPLPTLPSPGPPTTSGPLSQSPVFDISDKMETAIETESSTAPTFPPSSGLEPPTPPPGAGANWLRNKTLRERRRQKSTGGGPSPPNPLEASIANLSLGSPPSQPYPVNTMPQQARPSPRLARPVSASLPRHSLGLVGPSRRSRDPPPSPAVLAYLASIAATDPNDPTAQLDAILHPSDSVLVPPMAPPPLDSANPSCLHLYRLTQPSLPACLVDHPPSLVETWNAVFQNSTRIEGVQISHLGIYPILLNSSRDVEILIHPQDAAPFRRAMSAYLALPPACILTEEDLPRRLQIYFRRTTKSFRLASWTGLSRPLILQLLQMAARSPRDGFSETIKWDLAHVSLVPHPLPHDTMPLPPPLPQPILSSPATALPPPTDTPTTLPPPQPTSG